MSSDYYKAKVSNLSRVNLLYLPKQNYLYTMIIKQEGSTYKTGFPITDWSQYAKDFWEKNYIWNGGKTCIRKRIVNIKLSRKLSESKSISR